MTATFPRMVDIVPPAKRGEAVIEHYEVTEMDATLASIRGQYTEPGTVAVLRVQGRTMMSDTQFEHRTNYEVVRRAHGDVLIAGLGLGMILHPICRKPEVTSVTVIEKSADVIALIEPTVPNLSLLRIHHADIFTWKPSDRVVAPSRYDVIYFDIWPDVCGDFYEGMKTLTRRARTWRKPGAWVSCWSKDAMRDAARDDGRHWR